MRTKLLLLGSNTALIDDFFHQTDEAFEVLCSSLRYDDIIGHLKYFQPEAVVYCLSQENKEDVSRMVSVKRKLYGRHIPLIIIGDAGDCTEFTKIVPNTVDFILTKPLTAATIQTEIRKFLHGWNNPEEQAQDNAENTIDESAIPGDITLDSRVTDILADLGVKNAAGGQTSSVEGAGEGSQSSQKKHILVIDDDIRMLRVLKSHLEGEYEVATAISGAVGLRFLEKKTTDLILLDYEMPEEKGPEVLEKLHANEATKDIPVLFLTGAAERDKIRRALSLKPQGYLLKPIDQKTLMAKVKEVFLGGQADVQE
jgi:CheY-like chemotaxis protein